MPMPRLQQAALGGVGMVVNDFGMFPVGGMQRVKVHRRALTTGNCITSAAAEHVLTTNHAIDWDHATVIDHHPNTSQRCLLESWHSVPKHPTTEDGSCTTTETFGFVIPLLASEFHKG